MNEENKTNPINSQTTDDIGILLPIGSVVTLKNAEKSLMIIGILPQSEGQQYDYMAVLYPEGFLTPQEMFAFNHADIERVEFLGYMDLQYQAFRTGLADFLEERTDEEESNEN